ALSRTIAANGAGTTYSGRPAGDHTVALTDVPANCTVSGGASQTATVRGRRGDRGVHDQLYGAHGQPHGDDVDHWPERAEWLHGHRGSQPEQEHRAER